jgi:hypothetical protein
VALNHKEVKMAATKPTKQDPCDPPLDPEFGVIFVLTTDEDVKKFVGANQNDSRETAYHAPPLHLGVL